MLAIGASLLVAALLGAMKLLRDDRIEARAVRLVSTDGWLLQRGKAQYLWLRSGDVLFFKESDSSHVTAFRQRVLPAGKTGTAVAVNVFPTNPPWYPFDLSPDEKWLTCARRVPGVIRVFVVPLAGPKGKLTLSYRAPTHSLWLPIPPSYRPIDMLACHALPGARGESGILYGQS